jgi:hypothetical protein
MSTVGLGGDLSRGRNFDRVFDRFAWGIDYRRVSKIPGGGSMRLVALVLTVIAFGTGLGLVSVGTVQAHAGDGGGVVEVL